MTFVLKTRKEPDVHWTVISMHPFSTNPSFSYIFPVDDRLSCLYSDVLSFKTLLQLYSLEIWIFNEYLVWFHIILFVIEFHVFVYFI